MESKPGFILALIGGILTILMGIVWIASTGFLSTYLAMFGLKEMGWLAGVNIIVAILYIIFGVISIVAGVEMNHKDKVKSGGIMALIFGILAGNILTIIGGILGLVAAGK